MKGVNIKSFLFAGVLLLLFVPLIQKKLNIWKYSGTLMGSYKMAPDTSFSAKLWFSGDYGLIKEKWLQENFGFRNYYVRLNNQINWNLFRKSQTFNVLNGKEDYMFEYEYIAGYYGRDFVGIDSVNNISYKLKKLQDTLAKLNKLIIPVFALGKASFFPELIPDDYKSKAGPSNYLYMRERFKHDQVKFVDFNSYFQNFKHKSPVPIIPQYGIHWSSYTALLAYDSLVKFFEHTLKADLPDMKRTKFEMSWDLRDDDYDMGHALNVLRPPGTFFMGYPEYTVTYDSTKHKMLNFLEVGDSFWFQIYNTKLPDKMFHHRFWYYNEQMFPEARGNNPTLVSQIDVKPYIKEADIIVILHSEATLNRFGSGFIHACYKTYFP